MGGGIWLTAPIPIRSARNLEAEKGLVGSALGVRKS